MAYNPHAAGSGFHPSKYQKHRLLSALPLPCTITAHILPQVVLKTQRQLCLVNNRERDTPTGRFPTGNKGVYILGYEGGVVGKFCIQPEEFEILYRLS